MLKIALFGINNPTYYASEYDVLNVNLSELKKLEDELSFKIVHTKLLGSAEEAAKEVLWCNSNEVDMVLLQNSGFSSGDFAMEFEAIRVPLIFWGVEEPTESGDIKLHSMVSLNLYASIAKRKYTRKSYTNWVYGNADTSVFKNKFSKILKRQANIALLNDTKLAVIGDVAPTFFNLEVSAETITNNIGCNVMYFEEKHLTDEINKVSDNQIEEGFSILSTIVDTFSKDDDALIKSVRAACALNNLVNRENISSLAVSCWPYFQDVYGIVPCVAFTLLTKMAQVPITCEGDLGAGASMLVAKYLSGNIATVMDLTQLSKDSKGLLLWHCGISCSSIMPTKEEAKIIKHPMMNRKLGEDAKIGCSFDAVLPKGEYTLFRFTGDMRKLFCVTCTATNRLEGFDGTRFFVEDFMQNGKRFSGMDIINTILNEGIEHHILISNGNIEKKLKQFCKEREIEILNIMEYND